MPEKKETITVNGYTSSHIIALAVGACEKLNWNTKYAGENILVAYTPRSWNKWDLEITVEAVDNQLTVTSKQIHNESFDMSGRNKKRIAEFLAAFNEIKPGATDHKIGEWLGKINLLQQSTIAAAQEEVKQAEEINNVMNLGSSNLYITYGIKSTDTYKMGKQFYRSYTYRRLVEAIYKCVYSFRGDSCANEYVCAVYDQRLPGADAW